MSNNNKMFKIYELMPAVYRERDAAEGYPLRALLQIIQEQADILHTDIRQLWDDYFIETCSPWVIPYIGDLVSNNLLYDASRIEPSKIAEELFRDLTGPDLLPDMAIRVRADVAKTIYYRRRKGILPMLEELARDVTGWGAHAVEFFRLLEWTQNLNHLRFEAEDCIDLRNIEKVDRLDGAFDIWSHTVDVRHPVQVEGWHNIMNIGFFLWRLQSYPLIHAQARQSDSESCGITSALSAIRLLCLMHGGGKVMSPVFPQSFMFPARSVRHFFMTTSGATGFKNLCGRTSLTFMAYLIRVVAFTLSEMKVVSIRQLTRRYAGSF